MSGLNSLTIPCCRYLVSGLVAGALALTPLAPAGAAAIGPEPRSDPPGLAPGLVLDLRQAVASS